MPLGFDGLRKADVGGDRGLAAAASDILCRAATESGVEEVVKKTRTPTNSTKASRVVMPPRPREMRLMAMMQVVLKIFA